MGSPSCIERATIGSPGELDVPTDQLDTPTSQFQSYPAVEPSWNAPPYIHYENGLVCYDAVADTSLTTTTGNLASESAFAGLITFTCKPVIVSQVLENLRNERSYSLR
jgi:hypothetical protein